MARSRQPDGEPKRFNRAVGLADALNGSLDPLFRKRGFASRDILAQWAAIAPKPYDALSSPDRLSWPRGQKEAGGAVLYLRCDPSVMLAAAHEGERIAAAVNRYFGYVLVSQVKLSAEPFTRGSGPGDNPAPQVNVVTRARIGRLVNQVEDDGLREALRRLGHGVLAKSRR